MRRLILYVTSALLAFSPLCGPALADELILTNGDRLTGTLVEAKGGTLTFQTDYSEAMTIQTGSVESLSTDEPVMLRLKSGEILKGPIRTEGDSLAVGASGQRGAATFDWGQIKAINVPFALWDGSIWLGATHYEGNTQRLNVTFGFDAARSSETDRWNFSLLYNYGEEDGEVDTRDTYGAIKYDRFFTKKFYVYLSVEMLKDKFKDLNLRTIVGPGVGYQIWDDDIKALALEAGIAYFSEDRVNEEDDQWITARLAAKFRYKFAEWLRFTEHLIIYPQLESVGDYTLRNEATLITHLGSAWSLRVANIWERDSAPAMGVKKDDFKTSVNLQYSF